MEYYAHYTVLIDGATWGVDDYCFEAESDEEAKEIATEYGDTYVEIRNGRTKELLLDYIEDENGEEINYVY